MKSLIPCSASVAIENSMSDLFRNLTHDLEMSCVRGLSLLAWPPTGTKHLSFCRFTLQFKPRSEFMFIHYIVQFWFLDMLWFLEYRLFCVLVFLISACGVIRMNVGSRQSHLKPLETAKIKELLSKANLNFDSVENKALNDYLSKIFHSCPFGKCLCIENNQCDECDAFKNRTKRR